MAFEKTWRWFGANDTVKLTDLKQMGVEGVVTALHHIKNGDVWPVEEIMKVKTEIEKHGLRWSVVESLPVTEGIKTKTTDRPRLIENYRQSLRNLGACGIDTVCYNFMPVLDWARTDLHYMLPSGGEVMYFDFPKFVAFDAFILKRPNAANEYPADIVAKAEAIFDEMTAEEAELLAYNIIVVTQGFINGTVDGSTPDYKKVFLDYIATYKDIDRNVLRNNLADFLRDVVPVAEEVGVRLCVHPDDPPFPMLGMPRIVSSLEDMEWICNAVDSLSNGITFCTGSLSVRRENDLVDIVKKLGHRIHFTHLRNNLFTQDGCFYESGHITGTIKMEPIVKALLEEQYRRKAEGRTDMRIPFRPDHGIKILDDFTRSANPGYPLIGRMRGLAEISGIEAGIEYEMSTKKEFKLIQMKLNKFLLLLFVFFCSFLSAQSSRLDLQLSDSNWRVWLDSTATWKDDVLHLPRTLNISKITANKPSCGWEQLYKNKGVAGKVPASFEELFGKGNPLWRYHGVGWFTRELEIPADWNGKTVRLNIEKARLRVEVYVNEQLSGYDIVAETPYSMDITSYVKVGFKNRIAIRLTNPDGQRGWNDAPATEWGTKYKLIPGHDFGALGNVSITATDNCYIEDVFVKNLLPAKGRNIQLQIALKNKELEPENLKVEAEIIPYAGGNAIYKNTWDVVAAKDTLTDFSKQLQVPEAKLWDTESPNLYYCRVKISGNGTSDDYQVRFGFRVFEVKANAEGQNNFYLNGKRVRIRTSIDWGYYWQSGFYPTDEQARRNVENAKRIGHNCLSFHRRIGEPLVMKYADELGLMIYEEPGGMPGVDDLRASSWIADASYDKAYHAAFTMPEKFSRMVKRDRNHPSVMIWNLVNEQCTYDNLHKKIIAETWRADNSRFVVNQSGGQYGDASGYVPHMRPYEFNPRLNLIDDHTVLAKARFQESDLKAHQSQNDSSIIYWGEVRCYTGPDNFYLLSRPTDTIGYDYKSWKALGDKTEKYFKQNDYKNHPVIKSPADLSIQAGRGLMYIDGRLGQAIQLSNSNDGYAINGWSGTNLSLGDDMLAWYSALCDEGRNLKGPAADLAYWIRPLQIAIVRQNGKYFKVGETAMFNVSLFNENKLAAGEYLLQIKVKDGNGTYRNFNKEQKVTVKGGDYFTQLMIENLPLTMESSLKGGYITIEGKLLKNNKVVAEGTEQVLLQNRKPYAADLKDKSIAVLNWNAAEKSLTDANVSAVAFGKDSKAKTIVAAGLPTPEILTQLLKQVKGGAKLVLKFDSAWAKALYDSKILKQPVIRWGGKQKEYWNGNGWGFVDGLVGNQAIPSGRCIGTNSWEAPTDPVGFEPFVANYPQKSYGAFFFRPDTLLTLYGEIMYGKGRILLAPSYPVDANEAFNDMVFFELLK